MADTRPIALVGSTAVGKSALAIAYARATATEIVSVDSRCVYRYMDIGTAKPSPAERSEIRHHLVDLTDPDEEFSVARFLGAVREVVESARQRGRGLIFVGGTGYWMRALLGGETSAAVPPDPGLRVDLASLAPAELVDRLAALDPDAAARVDPFNARRLVRAIEVVRATGRPYAESRRRHPGIVDARMVGLTLPLPDLDRRIRARYDQMIEDGWIDEVRWLLGRGYAPELPSMSGIGYAEIVAHARGEIDIAEALERAGARCRRFARAQRRWFRSDDPSITWYDSREVDWRDLACSS